MQILRTLLGGSNISQTEKDGLCPMQAVAKTEFSLIKQKSCADFLALEYRENMGLGYFEL